MVMNLTVQTVFGLELASFPKSVEGMYRHPTIAKYLLSISGPTTAVFEGKYHEYGISAASNPTAIAYDSNAVYHKNIIVQFGNRAVYSSITQSFTPIPGGMTFEGEFDPKAKTIRFYETADDLCTYYYN